MANDFATARLRALDSDAGFPFLASALYSMVPVLTQEVPTMAIDRYWRLYINPSYLETITIDQAAMVIVHEAWHPLGDNWNRAAALGVKPEEARIWNLSTDVEINGKEDFAKRLPDPLTYAKLEVGDQLFAEQVFEILRKRPELRVESDAWVSDPSSGSPGQGNCGSCVHGRRAPWELPLPDQCDTPGHDEARTDVIRAVVAQAIVKQAHCGIGSVPANWLVWAGEIFSPRVDWQSIVYRAVVGAVSSFLGNHMSTHRRIGRRDMEDRRLLSPGRLAMRTRLALIVDTSGSMATDEIFSRVLGEVQGAIRASRATSVGVYFTDCVAAEVQQATSLEQLRPIGGGGTDMRGGFRAVAEDAIRNPELKPSLTVCLTDGLTPWDEQPPDCNTLIILIGKNGNGPGWKNLPDHDEIRIETCD